MTEATRARPATWVPTLYFAMGIPFSMVNWVVASMFKDLKYSDTAIMAATGSIVVVWSLKPFWAEFLDMSLPKRVWVLVMEGLLALILGVLALSMHLPGFFAIVTFLLWVIAFASATQDICADGIYITALDKQKQAEWIGLQGVFWNVGRLFATALVVWLAGKLEDSGIEKHMAWTYALGASATVMGVLGVYHYFRLPDGSVAHKPKDAKEVVDKFVDSVKAFANKKSILGMLIFVGLYRTGEGFLLGEAPLFIQAPISAGGLGMTLQQKALIDGTVSTAFILIAGWLGGLFVARYGLRKTLLFLAICLNVPHLCYVFLSQVQSPDHQLPLWMILTLVSIEKFGYSFGFVGNMLYMMQQIAPGKYKMTHYAFATAWMNLVLWPTQTVSGKLADWLGYRGFFIFVLIASIPSLFAAWKAPFPNPPDVDDGPDEGGEPKQARAAAAAAVEAPAGAAAAKF
ncbi:MAG TPA: MFS transporter [Polyangiaceae bacterium]|jgi:PAT family beta-lactamase induction signal transducer AmpG